MKEQESFTFEYIYFDERIHNDFSLLQYYERKKEFINVKYTCDY